MDSKNISFSGVQDKSARSKFGNWEMGSRYKCVELIGKGSYGQVVKCHDKTTNSFVAIKRMEIIFDEPINAKRAYREVRILRHLRHPNIVSLLDIASPAATQYMSKSGSSSGSKAEDKRRDSPAGHVPIPRSLGYMYMIFEFVDTDLSKIIKSNQFLSEDHVQYILYQILDGVRYLHSANVIHRDLKPANILVSCTDCSIKIADLGLARVVGSDLLTHGSERGSEWSRVSPTSLDHTSGEKDSPPDGRHLSHDLSMESLEARESASRRTYSFGETADHRLPAPPSLQRNLTKHVVTRWYRAPEVILSLSYSSAVDLWSVGCIFGELLSMVKASQSDYKKRRPLFPGDSCGDLSNDDDVDTGAVPVQGYETTLQALENLRASGGAVAGSGGAAGGELRVINPKLTPGPAAPRVAGVIPSDNLLAYNNQFGTIAQIGKNFATLQSSSYGSMYNSLYGNDLDDKACAQALEDVNRYEHTKSQLSIILDFIGTPSLEDMRHLDPRTFAMMSTIRKRPAKDLRALYPAADEGSLQMLRALLEFDPAKRMDEETALEHPFFDNIKALGYVTHRARPRASSESGSSSSGRRPSGKFERLVCTSPLSAEAERVRESQINIRNNELLYYAAQHNEE